MASATSWGRNCLRTLVDFFLDCCMCAPRRRKVTKLHLRRIWNMLCLGVRSVEITVVTFCLWCSKTWRRSMSRTLKVPNTEPTRNWRETIVQVSDGLETAISLWRNDQMWVSSSADVTCDLPRLIWGLEQPVEAKQDSWHVWTTELNSYLVLVSMSAWFQPREKLLYQSQWN